MDIADVKVGVFIKWFSFNTVYKVVAVQAGGGVVLRNTHNGNTFTVRGTSCRSTHYATPAENIRAVAREATHVQRG